MRLDGLEVGYSEDVLGPSGNEVCVPCMFPS